MNENNDLQLEIQQEEDKNAKLQVRTKASLVAEFKNIDGITDNDKLVKLLELYRKFESTRDTFNVDSNIDAIDKAIATLNSQLNAIITSVNQHERTLNEKYVKGFGEQLLELKNDIEQEEILQAKIIKLEKSNEDLLDNKEKNEIQINELNEKIVMLEQENNKYIALNTEIVARENNYINQIHEKDNLLTQKELELRDLESESSRKIEMLESEHSKEFVKMKESYEKQLQELQVNLEQANKQHADSIAKADKEKSILEMKVNNLQENITELKAEKDVLNATMKETREQYKVDLKVKDDEYKQELKAVEDKLEVERETSNNNMKNLRNQHKQELKDVREEHKAELKTLEGKVSEAQDKVLKSEVEVAKIQAKLEAKVESEANLKAELEDLREKLRVIEEEKNKKLEEETKKEDK